MITFRDCTRDLDLQSQLQRLRSLVREGDAETFLVEAGVFEQAAVDSVCTCKDGWGPVQAYCRDLLHIAGEAFVASHSDGHASASIEAALPVLENLARVELPATMMARIPEGYLHYALDPGDYVRAARRYRRDVGARQAAEAAVIGVRSIGTSLSGVVAAAVRSTRSCTVRPRGVTGRRHIATDTLLAIRITGWIREGRDVLVVDEGPGATGETLYCIGQWLLALGARPGQTVLFPSHTGGMGLAPDEHRTWFCARRKYPPPVDDARIQRVARVVGATEIENLSGGQWRHVVPGGRATPANVNHERLKYRIRDAQGQTYMLRFAGIGGWGRETFERARQLSECGVAPEVVELAHGFMAYRWEEGRLIRQAPDSTPGFFQAVGNYLAARCNRFRTGQAAKPDVLIPMLRENASEALSDEPAGLSDALRRLEELPEREAVIADARMRAVEWIETAAGFLKTDAWDHGDGTRLPGPVDAAWDVAAAGVEFGWNDEAISALVSRLPMQTADRRELESVVRAYRAPYAAACLGEADIALRETFDPDDRRLLARERTRYRNTLQRELVRTAANPV